MSFDLDETIVALASAYGPAPRAVVRLSGARTAECLYRAHAAEPGALDVVRSVRFHSQIELRRLGRPLELTLLFWPDHRSYTRQPAAEIHTVSSPPLIDLLIRQLCESGARLARPGEFTLRAFLAGRVDLAQAEAVLQVVDAQSQQQMDNALQQLAGGLGSGLRATQDELLNLLADLEAGLDFVDEEIEFVSDHQLARQLAESIERVDQLLQQMDRREAASTGLQVVLYGQPNVGKSTLFNRLLERQAAQVDSQAGTTRDFNAANWRVSPQLTVRLIDTAGVRDIDPSAAAAANIELLSQQKTTQQIEQADLRALCLDISRPLDDWEQRELDRPDPRRLVIANKLDRPPAISGELPEIAVSSHSGENLSQLVQRLRDRIATAAASEWNPHRGSQAFSALQQAGECLGLALAAVQHKLGHELVANELRGAVETLGVVTGAVHSEDILDRIFSRFCIGK